MQTIITRSGEFFPHDPGGRGFHVAYREDQVNHCPGCGRSQWFIGRLTAECGFCGCAIPLMDARLLPAGGGHSRNGRAFVPSAYAA